MTWRLLQITLWFRGSSFPLNYCNPERNHIQRWDLIFANLAKQDPGRSFKQEQEQTSPNHTQWINLISVVIEMQCIVCLQRILSWHCFGKFDMQPVENNATTRFMKNTQTHTHTNRMDSAVQANSLLVALSGVSLVFSVCLMLTYPNQLKNIHSAPGSTPLRNTVGLPVLATSLQSQCMRAAVHRQGTDCFADLRYKIIVQSWFVLFLEYSRNNDECYMLPLVIKLITVHDVNIT